MERTETERLDQLSRTVHEMARCDALSLSAALALLPDYSKEGTQAVLAGAARILAERFADLDGAVTRFTELVYEQKRIIEENIEEQRIP